MGPSLTHLLLGREGLPLVPDLLQLQMYFYTVYGLHIGCCLFNTVQETWCLLSSHDVLLSCIQYSHSASHTIRYTYMHLRSIDSLSKI